METSPSPGKNHWSTENAPSDTSSSVQSNPSPCADPANQLLPIEVRQRQAITEQLARAPRHSRDVSRQRLFFPLLPRRNNGTTAPGKYLLSMDHHQDFLWPGGRNQPEWLKIHTYSSICILRNFYSLEGGFGLFDFYLSSLPECK